ncbi:MAG: dockerin type I repeat-containing protein, partial [Clostridia bacterium]|nr:dockerin type I repeat-containing protein [Clostridia bacterium]
MKKKYLLLLFVLVGLLFTLTVGVSAEEADDLAALKITPGRTVSVTLPEGVGDYTYNEEIVILKGFSTDENGVTTLLFGCRADIPMGTYDLLYINGQAGMGISVYGMGDVNMDGDVTARDVVLMKQAIVGMAELSETQRVFSNTYDQDDVINTRDAVLVLQHIVGMDVILGTPDGDSAVCSGAALSIVDGYLYATYLDAPNTPVNLGKVKGEDGIGIVSIEKTASEGLVDTYTITFTNGDATTFTVTNGAQGIQGVQGLQGIQGVPGKDGRTPVITIQNGNWYIDGVNSGVAATGINGKDGNGISAIKKTSTEGLVDTYTITFTNGETTTFKVTNGAQGLQGVQGVQGIQGVPGKDGRTPVITIQKGNWYIDGVDSDVSAQGVKGDTGNGISGIKKTSTEGLVDTYTIT